MMGLGLDVGVVWDVVVKFDQDQFVDVVVDFGNSECEFFGKCVIMGVFDFVGQCCYFVMYGYGDQFDCEVFFF